MTSSKTNIFNSTISSEPIDEIYQLPVKFAIQELNQHLQYKSFRWDDYILTTFEKNHRPSTNDREYRLFKFDGYIYHQVWQGYIPTQNIEAGYRLWLRGVIQSPDGKSFVMLVSNNHVFVLKGNKCSQLLHCAQFDGLGAIHYSPSTQKYYGMLSKQISQHDQCRILTFVEVSLNFNKSGDLPANETNIREVYTKIVSFTELRIETWKTTIIKMIAPNMLIYEFQTEKPCSISYINQKCGWKHSLKLDAEITRPLYFDLKHHMIRCLPILSHSKLLSINPKNPREMLYHSTSSGGNELSLLVASGTEIELEEIINVPSGDISFISYCLFINHQTQSLYYWSYDNRSLTFTNINMSPVTKTNNKKTKSGDL
jgi:hypothetical protein